MNQSFIQLVAKQLQLKVSQVQQVIQLLHDGNTVPFIARYRKEMTGALDEVQIKDISDRYEYAVNLDARKQEVVRLIDEQGKLTEELRRAIEQAEKLQTVEDLYRPYKQKRRTRATVAKEKGLEPLADALLQFPMTALASLATPYVNEEKAVATVEEALAGAQDIIAERIADDAKVRTRIRELTFAKGKLVATVKKAELDEKRIFEMYYEYEEDVKKVAPHRVLAMNRGEKEDVLKVAVAAPQEEAIRFVEQTWIGRKQGAVVDLMKATIADSYKRLIEPAVEREIRAELSEVAEERAIHIFAQNLQNLLLQPPMKGKLVLGVDPAYRTGCKLAVVDDTGKLLDIGVIYPHAPKNDVAGAKAKVKAVIEKYAIELVAIGNGTASRETEQFIGDTLREIKRDIAYVIVNEAGASVYSASEMARSEFPDLQVEERSAISIARRLQDPLAELVKIDPKSVGVGQYQHDVSQKKLVESLTFVVETAVNKVGVNVNTASSALLQYVSGLSKTVAENVIKRRDEVGKFTTRKQLKDIPRLGAKTYEQCIGFMRILDGEEPLDRTAIHPESYPVVQKLLKMLSVTPAELGTKELQAKLAHLAIEDVAVKLNIGELTLRDIIDALGRPGRDPRDEFSQPLLRKDVLQLEDLKQGMELQGTVRNVVDFGAFIDIGVKQDGLVHISKLRKGFVKHPLDVVAVGDVVKVWVDDVDLKKGRVALTMLPFVTVE